MHAPANLLRPLRLAGLALLTAATGWSYTFILNDTTGLPIKWPEGTVALRLMLGDSSTLTDGTTYNGSAQAAAQAWNALLGSVQFSTTVTTGTPTDRNLRNEIAFATTAYGRSFDTNTLAITSGYSLGNDRVEADILVNSAYTWDSYRGSLRSGTQDIRRVLLHELGHVLGLDHPDEAGQTVAAIMNSRTSALDALAADDTTAGQLLYGPPTAPANDAFASAVTITLGSSTTQSLTGYNTKATKESGEPNHGGNSGGRSVWWRWTSPSGGGSMTIDTKGSYFDTTLGIYTGSTVGALTTVGSNDDIQNGVVQASTVTFNAAGSTTYQIGVDGFDRDTGGITLNVAFVPAAGTPPSITTQPAAATVTAGSSVSFSVTASGTAPLAYQWLLNGTAISGATSATYTLSSAQTTNAGNYSVTVTNGAGSVTSNTVSLVVNPAPSTGGGGGGGGGGGAPSLWFLGALALLGLGRWLGRRQA